jgi:hypothetical protein
MWRIKKVNDDPKEVEIPKEDKNDMRILIDYSTVDGYPCKASIEGQKGQIVSVFKHLLEHMPHFADLMEEAIREYKDTNP